MVQKVGHLDTRTHILGAVSVWILSQDYNNRVRYSVSRVHPTKVHARASLSKRTWEVRELGEVYIGLYTRIQLYLGFQGGHTVGPTSPIPGTLAACSSQHLATCKPSRWFVGPKVTLGGQLYGVSCTPCLSATLFHIAKKKDVPTIGL